MPDDLNPWTVTPTASIAPPPQDGEASGLRPGAVLAALLALGASIGFGVWLGSSDRSLAPPPAATPPPDQSRGPPQPAPSPVRFATAEPVPQQVREAYDRVRAVFVDGGPNALMKASVECAKRLQQDPTRLDECVAFDIYAADIVPPDGSDDSAAAWFHDAPDRDLALARAALPAGTDAADRLGQVRALTTIVPPKPKLHRAKAGAGKHAAAHRAAHKPKLSIRRAHVHRVHGPRRAGTAWEPPPSELHDPPDAPVDDLPPQAPLDLIPPH